MAWLYLPESVGLNSELISSSQSREPFVLSRGKPITLKSYKTKLKRNNWKKHLSLVTCEPSDKYVMSLVEKWTSLLPDSHVNRSQRQEIEREQKTKGGYGVQSLKSLARFDPVSYSWRTFQTSLMNGRHLTKYQNPFPKSGSILNGVLLERQKLVQTITETGYLYSHTNLNRSNSLIQYYPNPTKSDGIRNSLTYGAGNATLLGAVMMSTPTANDAKNWTMPKSQLKRADNLTKAITHLEMFPTSVATDQEKMPTGSLWRKVVMMPTPTASTQPNEGNMRLIRKAVKAGYLTKKEATQMMGKDPFKAQCKLKAEEYQDFQDMELITPPGGKMNPVFVEWLMGWPLGWTELEPVVTE